MTGDVNGTNTAKRVKLEHDNDLKAGEDWTSNLTDLAAAKNGAKVLFATDDGFAVCENLLKDTPPEWKEGVYTEYGKWMDGWETRRKRTPGHDWCLIKLGMPATIIGFEVDTRYFTGNYPPQISIQAGTLTKEQEAKLPPRRTFTGNEAYFDQIVIAKGLQTDKWTELVPATSLNPGTEETHRHLFKVDPSLASQSFTHVRLNLYPDGGIARLRVYGTPKVDWSVIPLSERIDLVALANGGQCIAYSDAHFGHPKNIITPGRASGMSDAWETARRVDRPPILQEDSEGKIIFSGEEWAIFRLGHAGIINAVEIDTHHFKCNYPDRCKLEACYTDPKNEAVLLNGQHAPEMWITILDSQHLLPNKPHYFSGSPLISAHGPVNYVKLSICPDGGISRLRLWGHIRN